jgi:hypothetical protein
VVLRRLTTTFVMTGLLATTGVADTSLCRIVCESRSGFRGSSKAAAAHHLHHSASLPRNSSSHIHANSRATVEHSTVNDSEIMLESPRCTQYQQLTTFLNGFRGTAPENISGTGNLAILLAVLVEARDKPAPSPASSPPDSYAAPPHSSPTTLRI